MEKTPENAAVAEMLGEEFSTAEDREQFERDVARLVASAELLASLEEVREHLGIPKAEVARRIGTQRSVVAKLLSGRTANATVSRVVEVADAMDCYFEVRIKPQPKRSARHAPIELSKPVMSSRAPVTEEIAVTA